MKKTETEETNMKLATTTGDFSAYTTSQSEAIRYIREAGFRYADYNFGPDYARRDGVYAADYGAHIRAVGDTAERLGVRLIQAHSPMGKPIAADNAAFLADTLRCVEACGAWGIPNLVVHSGYESGLTVKECFERNKAFYLPLLDAGERYNVNILVENFNKMSKPDVYWIDNAPDLLALIEYVNHPRFHAVWDAGHGNLQEMPQDEALRILGKQVYALHVQDNMGDRDTHLAPFFGTMSLDSLMHGLCEIGYDGYFTFEVGNFPSTPKEKREHPTDNRLRRAPLDLRIAAERFLYEMGKAILSAYGCFEE